ncbi:hypothetical protein ACFDTO_14815 [Microbacteriaceae bacterium 4G12]
MKFEDQRLLGIRLGALIATEENKYLVIERNEHYCLLDIHTARCVTLDVSLEHIPTIIHEDLQEQIKDIIPPENLKIIAQNVV